MTSVSAGHIILTPTQPVGSGRPLRESSPGPPHQESGALQTELPRPPLPHRKLCPNINSVEIVFGTCDSCRNSFCSMSLMVCHGVVVTILYKGPNPCGAGQSPEVGWRRCLLRDQIPGPCPGGEDKVLSP